MDISYLQENQEQFIQCMRNSGYSDGYIYRFQVLIHYVISNNEYYAWKTYADVYDSYKASTTSQNVLKQARSIFNGIKKFHLSGELSENNQRTPLISHDPFEELSQEFQKLISCYRNHGKANEKKERTILVESNCGITFLLFMQTQGCRQLCEISEEIILRFFLDKEGQLAKSKSYVKNLRAVFKAGIHWNAVQCQRIINLLPRIRTARKIIQYLTETEIRKIKAVLCDADAGLSYRDRAVGLLLVHYGLRRSDISGLRLSSIDWDTSVIRLVQQKTGQPCELPLIPVVGNALFDYITLERRNSSSPYVFLAERVPYEQICGNGTVNGVVDKILRLAHVRQNKGDRRGTHIFRHHFATTLMESGTPQPVISRAMGHTDSVSVETYLSADFAHLKECALGIGKYPVPEEVFDI